MEAAQLVEFRGEAAQVPPRQLVVVHVVHLEPGQGSLDELVADTPDGLLLSVNRSWSIDDRRVNFQFGVEAAWEIKGGRLGRLYRNATYDGRTTEFWGSLDAVCGPGDWVVWGVPNCGKGQPFQNARVGHGAAPARFRNVNIINTGRQS